MNKIQATVAIVAVLGGGTTIAVQHQERAAMRAELETLDVESADLPAIREEILRLSQQSIETRAADRERAVIAALEREAAAMRSEIRSTSRPKPGTISTARPKPPGREGVFDFSVLDQPPQPTARTSPRYPQEMKHARLTGEVTLSFVVDESGKVIEIEPIDSTHPAFTAAAMEAVASWTFSPGKKDGRLVPVRIQIPIKFNMTEPEWF